MGILVYRDGSAANAAAATLIAAQLIEKPDSVLALPGVPMAEGVYARLCGMTGSGVLDWSDVTVFHESEFVGAQSGQPRSQAGFLRQQLYGKVNLREKNIRIPDGSAQDLTAACTDFEESIFAAGGLDLALVCVGRNGSVAYNEPARDLTGVTHVSALSETSAEDAAGRLPDGRAQAPRAVTMGVGTLMGAKKLVVLALGPAVADAAARMIGGPISGSLPASALQMHADAVFILDEAAAVKL